MVASPKLLLWLVGVKDQLVEAFSPGGALILHHHS